MLKVPFTSARVTGSPAIVATRASFVGVLRDGFRLRAIPVNAHKAVRLDPSTVRAASAPAGDKNEAHIIHKNGLNCVVFMPHAFQQADRTLPGRVSEVTSGVELRL